VAPSGEGYTFEALTHIGPDDTFDSDYGRLLAGVGYGIAA
jgi:hypothetical protein